MRCSATLLVTILIRAAAVVFEQNHSSYKVECIDTLENCHLFGNIVDDTTTCEGQALLNCFPHGAHKIFGSMSSASRDELLEIVETIIPKFDFLDDFESVPISPSRRVVALRNGYVGDAESFKNYLHEISASGNVTELNLSSAGLTDSLCKILESFLDSDYLSIIHLDLGSNNAITSVGWNTLAATIGRKKSLVSISLSAVDFGNDDSLPFFKSLAKNTSIEKIVICHSDIGNQSVAALAAMPNLRELEIIHCKNVKDSSLIALGNSPHLEKLHMNGCAIECTDLSSLSDNPSAFPFLETLDLQQTEIDDDGAINLFAYLCNRNKAMTYVNLGNNSKITPTGIKKVKDMVHPLASSGYFQGYHVGS